MVRKESNKVSSSSLWISTTFVRSIHAEQKKNMLSKKYHSRHNLLYEYGKTVTAAATCCNICQVYVEVAINDSICWRWFKKFREGDWSCKCYIRFEQHLMVSDECMDTAITDTPSNSQKISGNVLGTLNSSRKMDAWTLLHYKVWSVGTTPAYSKAP